MVLRYDLRSTQDKRGGDFVTGGQGENIEGLNILTFKSSIWQFVIAVNASLSRKRILNTGNRHQLGSFIKRNPGVWNLSLCNER